MNNVFERVYLINLRRRPDRLAAALEAMRNADWPFREPEILSACDGSRVPVPHGWRTGSGSWGCRQSHVRALEMAISDGTEPVLVMEDDLVLRSDFRARCECFFRDVPGDWGCLMLGGQHHKEPRKVKPGVVRVMNAQRTHAYALRGRFLRDLYERWASGSQAHHIDWTFGSIQSIYKTYAPDPFIFGTTGSHSDICGRSNAQTFWEPPKGDEPLLVLDCDRETMEALRDFCVHTGLHRGADGVDERLHRVFGSEDVPSELAAYVRDLQWDAVNGDGMVAGIWHPRATVPMIAAHWSGPVRMIRSVDDFFSFLQSRHESPGLLLDIRRGDEPMVFAHDGGIGDLIAGLSIIKDLGGGELVLYPSKAHHTPFTAENVNGLLPFLQQQPYLSSVRFAERVPPNAFNLGAWRNHWNGRLNLTDMYYSWLGRQLPNRHRPWLHVEPKPEAEVIFVRCPRYHGTFPWKRAVRKYRGHSLFLGLPKEHEDFCRQFGEVPFRPTSFAEAAQIVAGAKLVCVNATSLYWVAEGLKKVICHEAPGDPGMRVCHWERAGFFYSLNEYAELPDLDVLDDLNADLAAKVKEADR